MQRLRERSGTVRGEVWCVRTEESVKVCVIVEREVLVRCGMVWRD